MANQVPGFNASADLQSREDSEAFVARTLENFNRLDQVYGKLADLLVLLGMSPKDKDVTAMLFVKHCIGAFDISERSVDFEKVTGRSAQSIGEDAFQLLQSLEGYPVLEEAVNALRVLCFDWPQGRYYVAEALPAMISVIDAITPLVQAMVSLPALNKEEALLLEKQAEIDARAAELRLKLNR
jgi:hypothetical protein